MCLYVIMLFYALFCCKMFICGLTVGRLFWRGVTLVCVLLLSIVSVGCCLLLGLVY